MELPASSNPVSYDSPQAVFAVYSDAQHHQDWVKITQCMSEDTQITMAGSRAVRASVVAALEKEYRGALDAILKQHGFEKPAADYIPPHASPMETIRALGTVVTDKPGFIAQVRDLDLQYEKRRSDSIDDASDSSHATFLPPGELGRVVVDGDTAVAKDFHGWAGHPLEFRKGEQGWRIHTSAIWLAVPQSFIDLLRRGDQLE